MSVDRQTSAPVAGAEGETQPMTQPISRMIQIRHTVSQPVVAAFIAGGAAGAVSRTVVSPLERLKILFQVQSVGRNEYKLSVPKALMKMWKDEGFKGLMRGNGTNCVRIVPYSAVQFSSYNLYKNVSKIPLQQALSCLWLMPISWNKVYSRIARRRLDSAKTFGLRRVSRHYLSHLHISSRHSQDSAFHSVSLFLDIERSTEASPSWHVGNACPNVQDGGRLFSPLQRDPAHSGWCRSICMWLDA